MSTITISNLSHRYQDTVVLENISCEFKPATITAVIGPNGSGKTTLIKAIAGLITPTEGTIHINGEDPQKARKRIGYVPQRFDFDRTLPITVTEFLQLSKCRDKHHSHVDKILETVSLTQMAHHRLGSLSGGQFQRALIARALMHRKDILILDEPSSGMDIEGEQTLYELIRHVRDTYSTTCIIVSHELSVVYRFADTVLCINKQQICAGIPREALTPDILEKLYGSHMHPIHHTH